MRNKIKQLLAKEDGFTLVELLGVIVILGLILAIAIPSIGGVIKKSEDEALRLETELVHNAARLYYAAEKDHEAPVTIAELVRLDYLDEKDKDRLITLFEDGITKDDIKGQASTEEHNLD